MVQARRDVHECNACGSRLSALQQQWRHALGGVRSRTAKQRSKRTAAAWAALASANHRQVLVALGNLLCLRAAIPADTSAGRWQQQLSHDVYVHELIQESEQAQCRTGPAHACKGSLPDAAMLYLLVLAADMPPNRLSAIHVQARSS